MSDNTQNVSSRLAADEFKLPYIVGLHDSIVPKLNSLYETSAMNITFMGLCYNTKTEDIYFAVRDKQSGLLRIDSGGNIKRFGPSSTEGRQCVYDDINDTVWVIGDRDIYYLSGEELVSVGSSSGSVYGFDIDKNTNTLWAATDNAVICVNLNTKEYKRVTITDDSEYSIYGLCVDSLTGDVWIGGESQDVHGAGRTYLYVMRGGVITSTPERVFILNSRLYRVADMMYNPISERLLLSISGGLYEYNLRQSGELARSALTDLPTIRLKYNPRTNTTFLSTSGPNGRIIEINNSCVVLRTIPMYTTVHVNTQGIAYDNFGNVLLSTFESSSPQVHRINKLIVNTENYIVNAGN